MSLAKPIRHLNVGYPTKSNVPALSPEQGKMLRVYSARLINESGSTIKAGLFQGMADQERKYLTYDGSVAVDATAALDAGTSTDLFVGNGTGFAMQADEPFQAVMVLVNGGSTGGTFTIQYWDGSAFTSVLQTIDVPTNFATGYQLIFFSPGVDWVKGGDSLVSGLFPDKYTILFSASGQSGTTTVTAADPARCVQYVPSLSTNTAFESSYDVNYPLQFGGLQDLIPYFSTASANNKVIAFYSQEN